MSFPYNCIPELYTISTKDSVAYIMNGDNPNPKVMPISLKFNFIFARDSLNELFLEHRNAITHTADIPWLITVAIAAPFTPMLNPYMKIGSRMMFATQPMRTVSMLVTVNP